MSNPYLEKAASMYDFWNDLTGKEHSELTARKHHLEKAIANNDTVESLASRIKDTGQRKFKARSRLGIGLVGAAAAGLYGVGRYKEHQNEIASRNLQQLFMLDKQAGLVGGAAKVAGKIAKPIGKGVKTVGNAILNTVNTAHGGKVKEFGIKNLGGKHTPDYKKFVGSSRAEQKTFVTGANLDKLKKLHRQQRVAQVGVYGSAFGITKSYSDGKKQVQPGMPSYYY